MKKLTLSFLALLVALASTAQSISVTWSLSDKENLSETTLTGDETALSYVTNSYTKGSKIASTATMTGSNAETGYTAVEYTPAFTSFTPSTKVTAKTTGHCIMLTVKPKSGHTFKPTSISFDAAKVGTDGGNIDVYYKVASGTETAIATGLAPLRNKISASNSTGYSHYDYKMGDILAEGGQVFTLYFYIYNLNGTDNENPKSIAFRNVNITGAVDERIFDVSQFLSAFTCTGKTSAAEATSIDLFDLTKELKNGGLASYKTKLYGDPTDFSVTCNEGYTATVDYSGHVAIVKIFQNGEQVFYFEVMFTVTDQKPKPAATPLKRGLMALNLSASGGSGNLVSWRSRETDDKNVRYKLFRGTSANAQPTKMNSGNPIMGKTNFNDTGGSASSYYRLEVYDGAGNLLETEVSGKTWTNQNMRVPLAAPPVDTRNGATYTPNDAAICDMDGDGEYEIILKWYPSNAKDAANSGTTSNIFFDCYKLDGTQLWRIDMGPNFFASAHTVQFIAWDFDGDGYGEFMAKTGPGTIDGEGNYVVMGNDDPTANWLNSRGKQVEGPEYITVFDGLTGAEISTIPYHTNYAAGASYWGDSNQNRSERYLAAIAWLDGADKNPSPIFARGYYSGAFVGAYDWDGVQLKERWVSRNTTKGQGLWGEGAHWISVGDCDGDGKQEIVYGSAALDDDGSLLYRTGLGHGDALHLGDLIPEREGMELFMVHEEKPYGYDLRDAKTGERLLYKTAGSDTGRGLAAHFDSSSPHSQFLYSAAAGMYDCLDGSEIAPSWAIGSSGAGINNRIYWDGDLYDEFFDKSIIAHWNPTGKYFDRYKFNNGNYVWGKLNNSSKNNPCVLGDLLGDWREEIVTWNESDKSLYICATSYTTDYRIPHLMDDLNYRAQVINQNCAYNQPPHLSFDPAVKYAGNPNQAVQEDLEPEPEPEPQPEITWTEKYKIDFEDGDYSMFTFNATKDVTQSIVTEANGTNSYEIYTTATRTVNLDLSQVGLGQYDLYKFEFDWATGGSNTDPSTLTVKADNAEGQLLTVSIPQGWATIAMTSGTDTLATYYNARPLSTPTSLFHFQFVGGDEGVYLTVTKDETIYVDSVKIYDTAARVTGINEVLGRSYNHTVFDNIQFSTYQAETPQPEPLLGDLDGDGHITIGDITLLISIYLGDTPDVPLAGSADLDSDQLITIQDVTQLIEIYLNANPEPTQE